MFDMQKKYISKEFFGKNCHCFETQDSEGRKYFVMYSNIKSSGIVSLGEKHNIKVEGNFKITVRQGPSVFGDELIFEVLCSGEPILTPKRNTYQNIELYMSLEEGAKFLREALKNVERVIESRKKESIQCQS